MKLLGVWSSLAERYAKPIDEDDIVDIMTGQVIQDRGVISSWDGSKQGYFTNVQAKKKTTKRAKVEEGPGEGVKELDDDERSEFATNDDTSGDAWHKAESNIAVAKDFDLEEVSL